MNSSSNPRNDATKEEEVAFVSSVCLYQGDHAHPMRGDVDALERQLTRDRRYDHIAKRLQRHILASERGLQHPTPAAVSNELYEGSSERPFLTLGSQDALHDVSVWPVKSKCFACNVFECGGREHDETMATLRKALIKKRIEGKHAYFVSDVVGGVFVAPKRKTAVALSDLSELLSTDFAATAASAHAVPLFHMAGCEVSPFPAFEAPDGGACLGVLRFLCQDQVTLYALCDATAWPLGSPRLLGIDDRTYSSLQKASAHALRLVPTPASC